MKKKWLSILALSLCACISIGSFSGCDLLGGGGSSGDPNGGKQLTEDEIYAEISKAMDATLAYKGGITMKETAVEDHASGYRSEYTVSMDPATNRLYAYAKTDYTSPNYTDYESYEKIFQQGGKAIGGRGYKHAVSLAQYKVSAGRYGFALPQYGTHQHAAPHRSVERAQGKIL